jgi:hypothetical protein
LCLSENNTMQIFDWYKESRSVKDEIWVEDLITCCPVLFGAPGCSSLNKFALIFNARAIDMMSFLLMFLFSWMWKPVCPAHPEYIG